MVQGQASFKLPSEQIYEKFEKGMECPGMVNNKKYREPLENSLKTALEKHKINQGNLGKEIAKGWCNAFDMWRRQELRGYGSRHFFYYWIGNKIKDKLNSNNFSDVMNAIYKKLPGEEGINKFRNLYPDISDAIFERAKILHDYYYNYNKLKEQAKSSSCSWKTELDQHLGKAKTAYGTLGSICGGEEQTKKSSYCKKFEEPNKGKEYQQPKELTCTAEDKEEEEESEEEDDDELEDVLDHFLDDDEEGEGNLSELSSRKIYARLDENSTRKAQEGYAKDVQNILDGAKVDRTSTEQIINAQYYASEERKREGANKGDCKFFYYWLGKKLYRTMDYTNFKGTMDKCKNKVFKSGMEHDCEFIVTPEKEEVFWALKTLFDYYYNGDVMREHLREGEKDCHNVYYRYLQKAQFAYKIMKRACKGDNSGNQECKEFEKMYEKCKEVQNSAPECRVTSAPGEPCGGGTKWETVALPPADEVSPSGSNTTTSIVVPSVITLVGIPAAVAFFLHKYDLLPSTIKNFLGSSSNRGRRRKGRSIKHDFDASTEKTYTLYSTIEASTVADSASTFTDESTVYNGGRPPSGRRGANNGRTQRRNIRYQRM